jgi:hypothetical protein
VSRATRESSPCKGALHPWAFLYSSTGIFYGFVHRHGMTRSVIGVAAVDSLIGGGIFDGSTTMVVGVSGVGKTVFGTQLLREGAISRNTRGLMVSLDEHPAQITPKPSGETCKNRSIQVRSGYCLKAPKSWTSMPFTTELLNSSRNMIFNEWLSMV